MSYIQHIPYNGSHGAIVIGSKHRTRLGIQAEFGCSITSKKVDPKQCIFFHTSSLKGTMKNKLI
jgi:hypothetical protein